MVMMMPIISLGQKHGYHIYGRVAPPLAPAEAYILHDKLSGGQTDSALIDKNGSFYFQGTIKDPEKVFLAIKKNRTGIYASDISYVELYLENASITVTSPDSLENAKVSGGEINNDNQALKTAIYNGTKARVAEIAKVYLAAPAEERNSKIITDRLKKLNDSLQMDTKTICLSFITNHPNSLVSVAALETYAGDAANPVIVESIFNSLSDGVRSGKIGAAFAVKIEQMKNTAINNLAPDFTMTDTAGKMVSLHDFRGGYVLIDFWASWCAPCRAENPNVLKAFNRFKGKGFNVLGISLDSEGNKDRWLNAVHHDQLPWTQLSDLKGWKNEAAGLYGVQAIPQNFLVSPDGKIVAKDLRGEDLEKELESIFRDTAKQ